MKCCTSCNRELELEHFYRDSSRKDGFANSCKECKKKHNTEQATSREVQPQLRQLVLERDSYMCQKCGETETELHCHHIDPVNINLIESVDIDNCVTLCINCHHEVHGYSWCKIRC